MTQLVEDHRRAARTASIVELARSLIRVPSQGGIDPPLGIIEATCAWLKSQELVPEIVRDRDGEPVGVSIELGTGGAPRYCLNACLDTAPFGDLSSWSVPPTGAEIHDGWLFGRGSADSKVAVAMFAHLAAEVACSSWRPTGTLAILFDADEHTGGFKGIRSYVQADSTLHGVMIGYPGLDAIAVGGRGFWRATVTLSGTSDHSGSRDPHPQNAIVKAATFIQAASDAAFPGDNDLDFPLPAKLTVTEIHGGQGYSIVPDLCAVRLDVRLTPSVDAQTVEARIRRICEEVDRSVPSRTPTTVEVDQTWPAYRLRTTSGLATALQQSARRVLGREVPLVVVGPSNIGNYLASLGIEATCGFGVDHRNLHAADERIEIASIGTVYETYLGAVTWLLSGDDRASLAQPPG